MSNIARLPQLGMNITALRKKKGLSLAELARRSGVSQHMLSLIEQEKINPTVATVWKISKGLDVSFQGIIGETGENKDLFDILRRDEAPVLMAENGSYTIRITSPVHLQDTLEIYHLFFKPGGALRSTPHYPGTEEFLTVVKGNLKVESAGGAGELYAGDSVRYRADDRHAIENKGDEEAEAFLVVQFKQD